MTDPNRFQDAAPPMASPFSQCRWIVFDAVGTLIDPEPRVAVAYHAVGSRYGSGLDIAEVGKRFRKAFRSSETDGFPGGPSERWLTSDAIEEARWRWIVREVFADIEHHEPCFLELWDHFARPTSWRCFPDVGAALTQLADAGYRLAIASNFDRRLNGLCDAFPELHAIERRIISATAGIRKPAPQFYSAIVSACQCEPQQILMVGDHPENDVTAPRTAGLQALHLDRDAKHGTEALTSLGELTHRLTRSS